MLQIPIVFESESLQIIADELQRIRRIYQHSQGWPIPPNPVQSPVARKGEEGTDMAQAVYVTPVDIAGEGFDQSMIDEIVSWELTPVYDGVDQPVIVGDKDDLTEQRVEAPDNTNVVFRHKWVDNAGNRSAAFTESVAVIASDTTPPANPVGIPAVRVGEEV